MIVLPPTLSCESNPFVRATVGVVSAISGAMAFGGCLFWCALVLRSHCFVCYWVGGWGYLAGAKFGAAKCGTTKLYHILPWELRTEATFLTLPDLCTFFLHYKVPRVRIVRHQTRFLQHQGMQGADPLEHPLEWEKIIGDIMLSL